MVVGRWPVSTWCSPRSSPPRCCGRSAARRCGRRWRTPTTRRSARRWPGSRPHAAYTRAGHGGSRAGRRHRAGVRGVRPPRVPHRRPGPAHPRRGGEQGLRRRRQVAFAGRPQPVRAGGGRLGAVQHPLRGRPGPPARRGVRRAARRRRGQAAGARDRRGAADAGRGTSPGGARRSRTGSPSCGRDYRATHGREPDRATQLQLAQQATLETREGKAPGRTLAEQVADWTAQARERDRRARSGAAGRRLHRPHRLRRRAERSGGPRAGRAAWCGGWPRSAPPGPCGTCTPRPSGCCAATALRRARRSASAVTDAVVGRGDRTEAVDPDRRARAGRRSAVADPGQRRAERLRAARVAPVHHQRGAAGRGEAGRRRPVPTQAEAPEAVAPHLDPVVCEAAVAVHEATHRVRLDAGQRQLVTAFATSPARLAVGIGPAGAGKTTAMRAFAAAWHTGQAGDGTRNGAGGGRVVPLATSAKAAQVLGDELGVRAENLHKFLHENDPDLRPAGPADGLVQAARRRRGAGRRGRHGRHPAARPAPRPRRAGGRGGAAAGRPRPARQRGRRRRAAPAGAGGRCHLPERPAPVQRPGRGRRDARPAPRRSARPGLLHGPRPDPLRAPRRHARGRLRRLGHRRPRRPHLGPGRGRHRTTWSRSTPGPAPNASPPATSPPRASSCTTATSPASGTGS